MNIFVLDQDPVKAAQLQCNKHVVKMILESAQIMSAVASIHGVATKYKPTHRNHPCTLWAGKAKENYRWLYQHAIALCKEYTYRYGKVHRSQEVIESLESLVQYLPEGFTAFVQCMPDDYKDQNSVVAYRKYYCSKNFGEWKNRDVPEWYKPTGVK